MPNIFVNDSGAVEQSFEVSFDPRSGYITTRKFRGSQGSITLKESDLKLSGYATKIKQGPVWELEASIEIDDRTGGGGADTPIDTWELHANVVEKDLLQSNAPGVSLVVPSDMSILRDALDGKLNFTDYETDYPNFISTSGDPEGLFDIIKSGVKSLIVYQPTLRWTRTASRAYQITNAVTGYGEVFSSSKLVYNYPQIPSGIAYQFLTSSTVNRSDGVSTYKGWLQSYPQITVAAYGKTQIVSEWQWGEWVISLFTIHT